ncbi:hypothetical protein BQ9231_00443 [Cedratvirus lausannensis]|uniref:Uncharacterized protein n=1 Tax=Cedratvirus lausannensis TaxID=2023205 RepID=A0A285PYR4_9VIRU|nr:hypothetical protein BQ9231_00443 [Cedratvirus lausannensis]
MWSKEVLLYPQETEELCLTSRDIIKMVHSLYLTVLKSFSYEELKDLCFAPNSTFPNVFDRDWGIWRDKARADFNISEEFFDLVRSLGGPQRYLQIASYAKLSPLSLAEMHEGEIEGVYEPYTGYIEADKRRDEKALSFFASLITPEQAKQVFDPDYSSLEEDVRITVDNWSLLDRELTYPSPVYDYSYLSLVLRHGRVDILDHILPYYFKLPKGFSVQRGDTVQSDDVLLQTCTWQEFIVLVESMLSSADLRIVDFIVSIYGEKEIRDFINLMNLDARSSLYLHGKPEEAYQIEKRFNNTYADYMVELVLGKKEKYYWLENNQGDIAFLMTLLPFLSTKLLEEFMDEGHDALLYPLTGSLITKHLQERAASSQEAV